MAITQKFKTVTTNLGRNAVAIAHATGSSIKLTHMAVGDGNGQSVEPNSAMTALVHEVYRGQINDIVINGEVQGEFTAELLIPQNTGGFFIREVALFFEDGTMFAIGNTPLTEKTELSSGAATDLLVRMIIRVLDAGTIEIFIDPAQVLATRDYVERLLNGHEKDKNAHAPAFGDHNEDEEAHQGAIKAVKEAEKNGQIGTSAVISKQTDLNAVITQGSYFFGEGTAGENAPPEMPSFFLVVQEADGNVKQTAHSLRGNDSLVRSYSKNMQTWTEWNFAGGEPYTGSVELKSTRSSSGTWTIGGLTPDKPLFILEECVGESKGHNAYIQFLSGGIPKKISDNNSANIMYAIGADGTVPRSNIAICIPEDTTVVVDIVTINNAKLYAFQ